MTPEEEFHRVVGKRSAHEFALAICKSVRLDPHRIDEDYHLEGDRVRVPVRGPNCMFMFAIDLKVERMAEAVPCFINGQSRDPQGQPHFKIRRWKRIMLPEPYEPLEHKVFLKRIAGGWEQTAADQLSPQMEDWFEGNTTGEWRWNGMFGYSFEHFEDAALFRLRWQ
jgi:hypothetical protein